MVLTQSNYIGILVYYSTFAEMCLLPFLLAECASTFFGPMCKNLFYLDILQHVSLQFRIAKREFGIILRAANVLNYQTTNLL